MAQYIHPDPTMYIPPVIPLVIATMYIPPVIAVNVAYHFVYLLPKVRPKKLTFIIT
jgi:hypothetical protein